MRLWLQVREPVSREHVSGNVTLYYYDMALNVKLPEGFHIEVPFGDPAERDGGLGFYVDRCWLDVAKSRFDVQLQECVIDPPEAYHLTRNQTAWRTDVDGTAAEFHAGLVAGGWHSYSGV